MHIRYEEFITQLLGCQEDIHAYAEGLLNKEGELLLKEVDDGLFRLMHWAKDRIQGGFNVQEEETEEEICGQETCGQDGQTIQERIR